MFTGSTRALTCPRVPRNEQIYALCLMCSCFFPLRLAEQPAAFFVLKQFLRTLAMQHVWKRVLNRADTSDLLSTALPIEIPAWPEGKMRSPKFVVSPIFVIIFISLTSS